MRMSIQGGDWWIEENTSSEAADDSDFWFMPKIW